ncbi:hypothetical protein CYY_000673 [Polysphondylium violaceum]|uniref:Chloride channel protein n=1 Tax=Polysphondylium violaceum TaxID=133409 RepID=A0A8J4Q2E4_9MYCE|nr:hypothetical protein CYY_000673 [Polysphondylium violaceum]
MPKADTVGFKSKQGGISRQAIKWAKFARLNNFYIWLYLAVVGLLGSISLVSIDLIFKYVVFAGRDNFINLTQNYFLQYLSFIVWTVVLAFASSFIVKKLCYASAGSGIPDLKSIFSGFWNPAVVQPMVLVWKVLGLLFSYGAGLSIGKEGPYIHISAILANTLLNIKPFKNIAPNETQRAQMLASCCALGVAATFGSPIGGVLFSIEVTGTYYLISNYWRAFFTATMGAVGIKILLSNPSNDLLESYRTFFANSNLNLATVQLLAFIITGVLCGLLSSLFISMYTKIYNWKKHHQDFLTKITPYGEVVIVAAITAIINFPLKFLRLDHASAVHTMFTAHDNVNSEELEIWTGSMPFNHGIILACFMYIVVKLVLTSVSITLPIPYGIYIPMFAIGAAVGRFVGEIMKVIFPHMEDIYPTGYAVVGAAALCGGATRTVSSAVIILELTNDLTYMVPVLLGVVLSCGIGNLMNRSIYDCFLKNKALPYLPFYKVKSDSLLASDVMKRDLYYVTQKTTLSQIANVLDKVNEPAIPIVESDANLQLIGTISRTTLEEVISYHERLHSYSFSRSPLSVSDTIISLDINGNIINNNSNNNDSDNSNNDSDDVELSILRNEVNHNNNNNNNNSNSNSNNDNNEGNIILHSNIGDHNNNYISNINNNINSNNNSNNNNNNNINENGISTSSSSGDINPNINNNGETLIDLVQMELQNPWVVIDLSPFTILESMPVRKIIFMFMMLGGNVLYVTNQGKLTGVVVKTELVQKNHMHN